MPDGLSLTVSGPVRFKAPRSDMGLVGGSPRPLKFLVVIQNRTKHAWDPIDYISQVENSNYPCSPEYYEVVHVGRKVRKRLIGPPANPVSPGRRAVFWDGWSCRWPDEIVYKAQLGPHGTAYFASPKPIFRMRADPGA